MGEDPKQKLIGLLKQWEETTNPNGLGLVVDREGTYYFVGYAGMGNVQFNPITNDHHYFTTIVELVGEGAFEQALFRPVYELGFKEVAELILIKD